jgi:mRNA interferase MazF
LVKDYVPQRGDIVRINFSPQAGREQAHRRPGLILSVQSYNAAVGLAVVAPITSKAKGYHFEVVLPPALGVRGVILSDQLKNLDWRSRKAVFEETAPEAVMDEVTARIIALLGLR